MPGVRYFFVIVFAVVASGVIYFIPPSCRRRALGHHRFLCLASRVHRLARVALDPPSSLSAGRPSNRPLSASMSRAIAFSCSLRISRHSARRSASRAIQLSSCAFVDISAFDAAEPQARCFNLDMKCAPGEQYGCFKVPLELKQEWIDDGKRGRLRELSAQFGYIDREGRHWDVPAGFRRTALPYRLFFRALIGGPWTDSYVKAAVIHDFYIRRKGVSAEAVHKVFYFALRAAGNSQRRAEEMYFAVAKFGPQWRTSTLRPMRRLGARARRCSTRSRSGTRMSGRRSRKASANGKHRRRSIARCSPCSCLTAPKSSGYRPSSHCPPSMLLSTMR